MIRRSFLRRLLKTGAAFGAAGSGAFGYGSLVERNHPVVERLKIAMPGLGPAWEGCRVVQISDLHLEPLHNPELVLRTVAIINSMKPDVIVLTGDYVTHDSRDIMALSAPLAGLKARAGVFAIPGNHDVWNGASRIAGALRHHGITWLRNNGVPLTDKGDTLWIGGMDSIWGGRPHIHEALKDRPGEAPVVLLMHEPDYADHVALASMPLLQLSGHTHGGQVCLPGGHPIQLPSWGRKYSRGLYQVGKVQLYVNRGLGCMDVPVRFACPPEITEFTLVPAVGETKSGVASFRPVT